MELKFYQVDAFANETFKGNPAGVCPLNEWLTDDVLQNIAAENNLSETGFFVKEKDGYRIRWFTPAVEVDLCGHATLAAAYVLYKYYDYQEESVSFNSRSGLLKVSKSGDHLMLNFPSDHVKKVELTEEFIIPFTIAPMEVYKGVSDYMLVFESEEYIKNMNPDLLSIAKIKARGIIVTAKGEDCGFVSRFFAPQCGIDEDPVTGSAHTTLTPYWSEKLGKKTMSARQVSKRGGNLQCTYLGERVEISGQAVTYLVGTIYF